MSFCTLSSLRFSARIEIDAPLAATNAVPHSAPSSARVSPMAGIRRAVSTGAMTPLTCSKAMP